MELEGVGRYELHGTGQAVVILSNPQADPDWWAGPIVQALVDEGYQAVPFTHTGPSFEPEDVVRDVGRFIAHLGAPVHLIGWSQGAAIAQEVALTEPEAVDAVVLLAPYGRQNAFGHLLQEAWRQLDKAGERLDSARTALVLLTAYAPSVLGDDDAVEPLIEGVRAWDAPLSGDSEARQRSGAFIEAYQLRLEALREIQAPCLVVGFELDADTFAVRAREVAEAIPGARYVEFPGAGHLMPVSDPGPVIEQILPFFNSLRTST